MVRSGAPVYPLRGALLPLIDLGQVLAGQRTGAVTAAEGASIVVVQSDDCRFGLVVDRIGDTQEIVIKPLFRPLQVIPLFVGATILGNGQVALVLDVAGMARTHELRTGGSRQRETSPESAAVASTSGKQWLLFAHGTAERVAVDLASVGRLETFATSALERAGDAEVIQYRGRIMPLVRLSSGPGQSPEGPASLATRVIVCREEGRQFGVIVDRIVDIVEQAVAAPAPTCPPGAVRSAVIQGRVTELLDVSSLARQLAVDVGLAN